MVLFTRVAVAPRCRVMPLSLFPEMVDHLRSTVPPSDQMPPVPPATVQLARDRAPRCDPTWPNTALFSAMTQFVRVIPCWLFTMTPPPAKLDWLREMRDAPTVTFPPST